MPYKTAFYLQPHVGGQESPLTRTRKVYGLSAPRWLARLTFRAGHGYEEVGVGPTENDPAFYGARLDALIAEMDGGLNCVLFHDFRRPRPQHYLTNYHGPAVVAVTAPIGSSSITLQIGEGNLGPSIGDYVGGDGRPHIVTGFSPTIARMTSIAPADGLITVRFKPPLSSAIPSGAELPIGKIPARFRLSGGDDSGQNEGEVGSPIEYALEFTEELL
ncbi:hypothetical protein [Novosphingobium guangzhouense]|uniref:hypothetical protein n=1 Tax=Novosphingobium guangzhouense TaxID=1850347 RepID=UPI001FE306AF|nr:hypothetical protein [Novosphingobium guangzhouense]